MTSLALVDVGYLYSSDPQSSHSGVYRAWWYTRHSSHTSHTAHAAHPAHTSHTSHTARTPRAAESFRPEGDAHLLGLVELASLGPAGQESGHRRASRDADGRRGARCERDQRAEPCRGVRVRVVSGGAQRTVRFRKKSRYTVVHSLPNQNRRATLWSAGRHTLACTCSRGRLLIYL